MICRLCLCSLVKENAIMLFEATQLEAKAIKLIAKYFHFEVTQDDPISTSLCEDCSDHLEEFHKFWVYVDKKQSSLGSEFLAVQCNDAKEDTSVTIDVNAENVDNQEEILLDLKDIPIPLETCNIDAALPPENENAVVEIKLDVDFTDNLKNVQDDDGSLDDDTPLLNLKNKMRKKFPRYVTKSVQKYTRLKKNVGKCRRVLKSTFGEESKKDTAKRNEEFIEKSMQLSCDLCNLSVTNYNELRTHFQELHNSKAYVRCCGSTYRKPNLLVDHVQWHTDPSKFKCGICDKQLRSSKCLASHMNMIHSKDEDNAETLSCPLCYKVFRRKKCLDNHVQRHKNDKEYPCEICNKSFANPQRLRKHIESIHENLHRHICDVCGKKFKFKPSFERHVLEHQGIVEPPVQCDICGEWSKNKHVHRLHQFKHDNIDVECKYCGRKCRSRTALRGHINYMHKTQNNLQCSFCDKTFKVTKNLEEHMATHTGTQLYSCPHCSKECRSRSNMYVHIKRNHVQEWVQSKMARSNDPNLKAEHINPS